MAETVKYSKKYLCILIFEVLDKIIIKIITNKIPIILYPRFSEIQFNKSDLDLNLWSDVDRGCFSVCRIFNDLLINSSLF